MSTKFLKLKEVLKENLGLTDMQAWEAAKSIQDGQYDVIRANTKLSLSLQKNFNTSEENARNLAKAILNACLE